MKNYLVMTGWTEIPDNLNPSKPKRFPQFKGNIEVWAINRQVAAMCVLVDFVDLGETVKEITAKDLIGTPLMPNIPNNLLCGSKNLIAN